MRSEILLRKKSSGIHTELLSEEMKNYLLMLRHQRSLSKKDKEKSDSKIINKHTCVCI